MKVAMVGLGRMGLPMAAHLQAGGHVVVGFDALPAARARAGERGLNVVGVLGDVVGVDLVCTSLPDTAHVESVYGDLFEMLTPGTVCADLSTIDVEASRRLASVAAGHQVGFLDTPVSGTSIHAEAGTLVVMVGGSTDSLEVARSALDCFASRVEHVGSNGSGLLLKLVTNRLLTSHLAAIAEAVIDMESVGLDVRQGIELIRSGAVPKLLDYKAEPLIERDFTPAFTVDLMRKDLRLAAKALPDARLGGLSRQILEEAAELGFGESDLAALIEALQPAGREAGGTP